MLQIIWTCYIQQNQKKVYCYEQVQDGCLPRSWKSVNQLIQYWKRTPLNYINKSNINARKMQLWPLGTANPQSYASAPFTQWPAVGHCGPWLCMGHLRTKLDCSAEYKQLCLWSHIKIFKTIYLLHVSFKFFILQ